MNLVAMDLAARIRYSLGLIGLLLVPVGPAWSATGGIDGIVLDPDGRPLPGVIVSLHSDGQSVPMLTSTDLQGQFRFGDLPAGRYTPVAALQGFQEYVHPVVEVEEGRTALIEIRLPLVIMERVLIQERVDSPGIDESPQKTMIPIRVLSLLPLETDRFTESLPLVPGVVRGPDGRLNFNGSRASQSILLVNGSNVTDPLTGEFAIELPMKAIDAVEVHTLPYSAEYGRVTGAVAEVSTKAGEDAWDVDFGSLWPSFRWRDGTIAGIRSATPRIQVSGPIEKGKAWFSQGFTYRFVRSRVYDMTVPGADEQILESFDTFTQLDFKLSDQHRLTTTFSYFPVETDNWGIDTLHPEEATPDFKSWGWNVAVNERWSVGSATLLETTLALKSYDVAVRPKSKEPALLEPSGARRNYFNELNRESERWDLNFSCTHSIDDWHGSHVVKAGTEIARRSFQGTDRSGPAEVVGTDGRLLRTIDFVGSPEIGAEDVEVSGYIQDRWRPSPRLGLDLGMRFDYERITEAVHVSPRLAFAYSVREDGSTLVKGGAGIFFDQVYLHAGSYERFQRRVETVFGVDGSPLGPSRIFDNRIAPEGLDVPRSTTWNVELDQALGKDWMVRINYRERQGSNELVVDRLEDSPEGPALLLSSRGESKATEFDITARKGFANGGELFLSYVKSRSAGELNEFGVVYGDLRTPVLWPSEYSLQAFDVPHRVLMWGVLELPKKITVVPGLEWRQGFPYTVYYEDYSVSGERNRGGRFPSFLSIDVRVTKRISILGRDVGIGAQLYNLTGRFNPRDVQDNLGSPTFGEFSNSRGISGSLKLEIAF